MVNRFGTDGIKKICVCTTGCTVSSGDVWNNGDKARKLCYSINFYGLVEKHTYIITML